ncbi:MAG: S1C family serine protease [Sumerlaeia bacterium]
MIKPTPIFSRNLPASLLAILMLLFPVAAPLSAQDDEENVPLPEFMEGTLEELPDTLAPSAESTLGETMYYSLKGGGELIGRVIKQTPEAQFIDLGSEIVRLTPGQISRQQPLSEAREQALQLNNQENPLLLVTQQDSTSEDFLSQTEILERVKESIVLISNPGGAGSGFVYDLQGRIVTNHHVIAGEKYHTVNYFVKNDKNQWIKKTFRNVEVEAYSYLYDVALLRLNLDDVKEEGIELKPLPLATRRTLRVGEAVYAVGNPGGLGRMLEHTVSEGIVSSLTRNVRDVLYIQTTAAVNPGNSGGPLVNAQGEVVGLITLKSILQEGIGFALPVELIDHFLAHAESFAFNDQAQNSGFRYLSPP